MMMVYNKNNNLSILFVPSCTRLAPGPRYRVYQYLPYLKQAGIHYKVFPINGEKTTKDMINSPNYGKFRQTLYYLQLTFEKLVRFFVIFYLGSRYRVVFFQRTSFPFGLEKIIKKVNKNIIYDLDDAIFLPDNADDKNKGLLYQLKKYSKAKEIPAMLKIAKCVIIENKYIESYVQNYCKNISKIIDPIDTKNIQIRSYDNLSINYITIGWIGSPSTISYLKALDDVFRILNQRYKIRLKIIGAKYQLEGVEVITEKWSEETEWTHLSSFDIGVMPMPDDEWTRGKLGVKMLQYMAVGVPAVVSYTPTNEEIIKNAVNGFIARNKEEWVSILSRLTENPSLRQELGLRGRQTVEKLCSLDVNTPKLINLFWEIID